jgi:hypothetical protein
MASNLGALRASMANAQNSYYKGCICGGGSCVSMKTQSPFYLYDSSGKNLQSPAYYTTQGASCGDPTGLASSCFFQVTTSVVAECLPTPLPTSNPSPPWQCGTNGAEFIQIAYTVGPNPLHSPVPVVPVTIQSGVYANVSDIVSAAPSPSPAVCP